MAKWVLTTVLLCAAAANAQLTLGESLKLNLTGSLGYGYSGAFGNTDYGSNHGNGITGSADLKGYYFHPNFLSFDFHPYYDRSQANSESQTIVRGSGFGGSVGLFGGSHFPGSISFGKFYSSNSEFRVAGLPSFIGDSSGQNFGVSWSALVPKWPTLGVNYSQSSTSSSVEGIEGESKGSGRNFNVNSGYRLAGFDLHADYSKSRSGFTTPAVLTPLSFVSEGTSTSYGVTAQHNLPLSGAISLGWGRSGFVSGEGSKWTADSFSAGANLTPWRSLSVSQNLNYSTNLAAALSRTELGNDGVASLRLIDSNALFYTTQATYTIGYGLAVSGYFNHRLQSFSGRTFSDSQYGANLRYNKQSRLFGILYFGFGLVDTANKYGNTGLGIVANLGISRKVGHWETAADFNYAQGVQTLGTLGTTSSYTYGGSVRRRLNRETFWVGSFRGGHSGFGMMEGAGNRAESFGSSLSWKKIGISGTYSQSSGTAVLTSQGVLTATPVGALITDDFLYFNARSYAITLSTTLRRRISLVGGYANVFSDTRQLGLATTNAGQHYNAQVEYRLRKFSIVGGFNRGEQESSKLAGPPRVVNSFRLSLSRWFNVF